MTFDVSVKQDLREAVVLMEKDRDTLMPKGSARERKDMLSALQSVLEGQKKETLAGYAALKENERFAHDLSKNAHILGWYIWTEKAHDPKQVSRVLSSINVVAHHLSTSPDVDIWMRQAQKEARNDNWDKRNFELMERLYRLGKAVSPELVRAISETSNECNNAWAEAKPKNDWQGVKPILKKLFDLVRERADIYGKVLNCDPFDATLSLHCESNSRASIDPLFNDLKAQLPPLIKQIVDRQKAAGPIKSFELSPESKDAVIGQLIDALGFSLEKGRVDMSPHPFSGGTKHDSRITYSKAETALISLFSLLHEAGHAFYTQELPEAWEGQPVGADSDLSIHESQSLTMEKQVGFSNEGTAFLYDLICSADKTFARQGSADDFRRLVQRVTPSFIRVEADEVTYPLHVILRYEMEKMLFDGRMTIDDVPDVWNAKMKEYLGLEVPDMKQGCMQDIHWYSGGFGYFPTYTQGALYAAQIFAAIRKAIPDIAVQIRNGDFTALKQWLKTNIHRYGQLYTPAQLIAHATGAKPSAQFFIDHIKQRYLAA